MSRRLPPGHLPHLVVLVVLVLAFAVVVALTGVPRALPPIFVIVTGIGLFIVPLVLAAPVVRELEADGRAVEDIPPEELPSGWRVRYIGLIAGTGLALVPIGLVWLAFADWRLALVAMAACFLLILTPGIVSSVRGAGSSRA